MGRGGGIDGLMACWSGLAYGSEFLAPVIQSEPLLRQQGCGRVQEHGDRGVGAGDA